MERSTLKYTAAADECGTGDDVMNTRCFAVSVQRPLMTIFTMFFMPLALTSCNGGNPTSTDVTRNKTYWGGYQPDCEYIVQQDVFVLSVSGGQAQLYAPEQDTHSESATGEKYTVPSLEEYRRDPPKRSYILGILPKGSPIRIDKFELYSFSEDTQLYIHARPTEGQFKGKDVEIQGLSVQTGDGLARSPMPEYLKKGDGSAARNKSTTLPVQE